MKFKWAKLGGLSLPSLLMSSLAKKVHTYMGERAILQHTHLKLNRYGKWAVEKFN